MKKHYYPKYYLKNSNREKRSTLFFVDYKQSFQSFIKKVSKFYFLYMMIFTHFIYSQVKFNFTNCDTSEIVNNHIIFRAELDTISCLNSYPTNYTTVDFPCEIIPLIINKRSRYEKIIFEAKPHLIITILPTLYEKQH